MSGKYIAFGKHEDNFTHEIFSSENKARKYCDMVNKKYCEDNDIDYEKYIKGNLYDYFGGFPMVVIWAGYNRFGLLKEEDSND
jgi:hypothetical protein